MDRLIVPEKQKEFNCKYAAPSILTERFVAYILNAEENEIRDALTGAGTLIVYNENVGEKTYNGYSVIYSLEKQTDGYLVKMTGEPGEGEENGNGAV